MNNIIELCLFVITQFIKTDCFALISVSLAILLISRLIKYITTGRKGVK